MIEQIEQGKIVTVEKTCKTSEIIWNKHATCEGVFLKHLVVAENTDGKFSCHLVRVQAGCQISDHTHNNNWELHEVITGEGKGYIKEEEIPYAVGSMIVIPQGQNHRVVAGEQDLFLLAKFIPALL